MSIEDWKSFKAMLIGLHPADAGSEDLRVELPT